MVSFNSCVNANKLCSECALYEGGHSTLWIYDNQQCESRGRTVRGHTEKNTNVKVSTHVSRRELT